MHTEAAGLRFADASEWVMPRPLQWALGLSLGLHLGALLGVPSWLPKAPEAPPVLHVTLRPAPVQPTPATVAPAAPPAPVVVAPPVMPAEPTAHRPERTPSPRAVEVPPRAPKLISKPRVAAQSARRTPPVVTPAEKAPEPPTAMPARAPETAPAPGPTATLPGPPSPGDAAPDNVATASAPHRAPVPTEPSPAQLAAYRDTLGTLFSREQQYPRLAAMRGWEGEVVLRISIARKGKLVAVRVLRSSGHEVLDRNAEALANALSPYPAFPDDLAAPELEITVPIHYRLKQTS